MERGSYLMLEPGMRVLDAQGTDVGSVEEVVADEGLDIFRGIVLNRAGWRTGNVFVPGDAVAAVDGSIVTLTLHRDVLGRLEPVRSARSGEERAADFTPSSPGT